MRRDAVPSFGVPRFSCAVRNVLLQFSFFFSSGKEDDHLGSCDDALKAPSTEAVLSQSGSLQPAWLQEPNPAWPRVPEPLLRHSPERQDRRSLNLPGPECASACVLSRFSRVRLCATLWTAACQAPLSMRFSRQEYWSGLPCPPNQGSLTSTCIGRRALYHYSHLGSPVCK